MKNPEFEKTIENFCLAIQQRVEQMETQNSVKDKQVNENNFSKEIKNFKGGALCR